VVYQPLFIWKAYLWIKLSFAQRVLDHEEINATQEPAIKQQLVIKNSIEAAGPARILAGHSHMRVEKLFYGGTPRPGQSQLDPNTCCIMSRHDRV
jgi:hypothetical protein